MAPSTLPRGIYPPVVSFFKDDKDETLDTETLKKHVVRMVRAGCAGVVVQGSNGEAVHLTRDERKANVKAAREAFDDAGFKNAVLIAGCGVQSVHETVIFCKDAAEAGAEYAMVLPPHYYKAWVPLNDIVQYFRDVADESPIPIIIYNFPAPVGGIDLDSDTLTALAQHPNIAGTKLTCGNVGKASRLAQIPGFSVLGGGADLQTPFLFVGAVGTIPGIANILPSLCVQAFKAFESGDYKRCMELQANLAESDWCVIKSLVAGTKYALSKYYGYGGYGRRPIARPDDRIKQLFGESFDKFIALEQQAFKETEVKP
ncbi:hypothetical protein CANCADRAFT_135363 [Tortispora caseinolytica NRRL Y-17796]|uniref:Uncharacterized protein n=1 Tax=Tortispora caseinolytica NRRL Y-17796 TaxID=767744 RepID=A0A1E4TBV9_9ASCO|nr:hypothetical protein CANCADRAFT_135363 [Tortispora caseinolytica NRRL Y-17796]